MAQFMGSKRADVVQVARGLIGENYADHVGARMLECSIGQ